PGQLLHDGVEPGILQRQIGFENGCDHVAQRLRPFRYAKHVVVQVGVKRVELPGGLDMKAVMLKGVDDFPHRQRYASQVDEVSAQLECPALKASLGRPVVEQFVLDRFNAVVERLHGCEMTVDHNVEQPVYQCTDAVLLAADLLPSPCDLSDVEVGRQTHCD